jgi:hypothetical protein
LENNLAPHRAEWKNSKVQVGSLSIIFFRFHLRQSNKYRGIKQWWKDKSRAQWDNSRRRSINSRIIGLQKWNISGGGGTARDTTWSTTTLALGLRLKQGFAKVRTKNEAQESHFTLPGV